MTKRASWGLRLFALAFSVLLWWMAPRPTGPDTGTGTFVDRPVLVPVEVRGLADDLAVVEAPEWVTVRLRTSRLQPANADRVQVYIDLSQYDAGSHQVPVTVVAPVTVQVVEVEPPFVDVRTEAIVSRDFAVTVAAMGLPSEASVEVLTPEPARVWVRGTAGLLEQVSEVIAPVRLMATSGVQTGMVAVQAIDKDGFVLSGVHIEPEQVFVSVVVTPDPADDSDPHAADEEV